MTSESPRPLHRQPSQLSSPFIASEHTGDNKKHLLLASSGSVATIKLPDIVKELSRYNDLSIRIVLTQAAENFLAGQSTTQPVVESLCNTKNVDGIYRDEDEWDKLWVRGGSILHIELRRWADILVIAPLSANSMAKMIAGLADSLLLSVVRAWDTTGEIEGSRKKRIVLAPAMNTAMWRHPVTRKQIQVLEEDWAVDQERDGWIELLRPAEKTLACGDVGVGAMREWSEIVSVIEIRLNLKDKDI